MSDVSKLPAPLTEVWEWQVEAACRGLDASVSSTPRMSGAPHVDGAWIRPNASALRARYVRRAWSGR